jgi:4-oxalocrotonate tautomerase family enzyme
MPVITVEGPPMSDDTKREMVKKLTDIAVEAYRIENIIVYIKENAPENIGVNGIRLSDT